MVLYRKYRPQTLDDIIGQDIAKSTLKSAIVNDKLAHAYLFFGPRGTGKTSTARILAKIVNCEKREVSRETPCNKCASCISITEGTSLDVIEMDAASNRGIDDIRSLRENIKLAPTSSSKKVYIIDEVHMLSTEAFNALLKTLEEPPSHVMFILATTEIQKIPPTILSRVSRLDFKQASIRELIESLRAVAKAEKIDIDEEALNVLAKRAQGSFRDGIKFLDLLSNFGKITRQIVENTLGAGTFENICSLLVSIAEKDPSGALKKLAKEMETGLNVKELSLSIIDVLRQLLYIKHGLGENLVKLEIGGQRYVALEELAEKFDLSKLAQTIEAFQNSFETIRYAPIPTLPLELAVVESCGEGQEVSQMVDDRGLKIEVEDGKSKIEEEIHPPTSSIKDLSSSIDHPSSNSSSPDLKRIADHWTYILETIRAYNFSLEALLRSSKIKSCNGTSLVFEVPYSFHQRIMDAPKSRDILESVMSDVLGKKIVVSTVLGQRPIEREEIANIEVAGDDEIVRLASEIFSSTDTN